MCVVEDWRKGNRRKAKAYIFIPLVTEHGPFDHAITKCQLSPTSNFRLVTHVCGEYRILDTEFKTMLHNQRTTSYDIHSPNLKSPFYLCAFLRYVHIFEL